MKERPILFSAPMVRAILEGRKTQTRRIVKPVGNDEGFVIIDYGNGGWPYRSDDGDSTTHTVKRGGKLYHDETPHACPYGQTGDRLWVRETWGLHSYGDETNWLSASGAAITKDTLALWDLAYRADFGPMQDDCHWRPSIHMPRWASRILLEVTGISVERLQDISQDDAKAEGVEQMGACPGLGLYRNYLDPMTGYIRPDDAFSSLWNSINGAASWDANPWVWVIEFKRVEA